MIYKTRICSSETMVFNLIHERGNLQSHLTSYYEEVLLWLSKRITVQALHPISYLIYELKLPVTEVSTSIKILACSEPDKPVW